MVTLSAPSGAQLVAAAEVWHGESKLPELTQADAWRKTPGYHTPLCFFARRPDALLVIPMPVDGVENLRVIAALAPDDNAAELPDFIGQQYAQAVISGALYQAATTAGSGVTADLASAFANEYGHALGAAKLRTAAGYNHDTLRVLPHPFI
jgi:hypothetical protein